MKHLVFRCLDFYSSKNRIVESMITSVECRRVLARCLNWTGKKNEEGKKFVEYCNS